MGEPTPDLRREVESAIRKAFDGVRLGDGVSLEEAKIIDTWRLPTPAERERIRDSEVTDDWSKVAASDLEDPDSAIAHLDPEGLRYYLPALMLRLLEAYRPGEMWCIGTVIALDQRGGHPKGFLEALTPAQRQAIALYVHALPGLVSLDAEHTARITRAYRDIWSRYVPNPPAG